MSGYNSMHEHFPLLQFLVTDFHDGRETFFFKSYKKVNEKKIQQT